MKHLGDITQIHGDKVPIVDIITGGSPCQDLSVAGKRAGLEGERSGLFMEQLRIVKEMREASERQLSFSGTNYNLRDIKPRFMVWENVPGAYSSNGGRDFQAVLTEIIRIVQPKAPDVPLPPNGRWSKSGCLMGIGANGVPFSVAYRLHDAQFWGVPQRRKRIALVADFGGTAAPEILFEREGLRGNPEESGIKGEGTPEGAQGSAGAISFQERAGKPGGVKASSSSTNELEPSKPTTGRPSSIIALEGNGARPSHQGDGFSSNDVSYTLNSTEKHGVCYGLDRASFNQGKNAQFGISINEEIAPTVCAKGPGGGNDDKVGALCARDYKGVGNQYVNEGKVIVQNGRQQT